MGRNRNSMDITILTCNYNTPELIVNMLKSVKQTCSQIPNLVVMNTSTEVSDILDVNKIPYFNYRGGIHGEAVNLGFKKIKTRYVLLVDSDILFIKDFKPAFDKFKSLNLAIMGKVVGDCAGKLLYPRVEPWYCFIDLNILKSKKIEFFDRDRSIKIPNTRMYDVGSTMFEDITNAGLLIGDANLENYFTHFGGMSWREQKYNPNFEDSDIDFGGTHPHKVLYDMALQIKQTYIQKTEYLKDINIKGIFKNE